MQLALPDPFRYPVGITWDTSNGRGVLAVCRSGALKMCAREIAKWRSNLMGVQQGGSAGAEGCTVHMERLVNTRRTQQRAVLFIWGNGRRGLWTQGEHIGRIVTCGVAGAILLLWMRMRHLRINVMSRSTADVRKKKQILQAGQEQIQTSLTFLARVKVSLSRTGRKRGWEDLEKNVWSLGIKSMHIALVEYIWGKVEHTADPRIGVW